MNRKQIVGRWGEEVAGEFLLGKGFSFLERNVHTPYGELDLVMIDKDVVVFVEVKTRTSTSFGTPEISIHAKKSDHILHSALAYMQIHTELQMNWRVDVVAVEGKPGDPEPAILWFENALQ
jgi:putative endonuclease